MAEWNRGWILLNNIRFYLSSTQPRMGCRLILLAIVWSCSLAHAFDAETIKNLRDDVRAIADDDLTLVLAAVLQHKSVAIYLHPEMQGRLPVIIAIGKPYSYQTVEISLYGKPVIVTTNPKDLKIAVKLKPICSADTCKVEVGYKPEGIFGDVWLKKEADQWVVTKADIYEGA